MTASGSNTLPTIGFLTVRAYEPLGLIGAYLVLNTTGRPVEFHCTAPVRPNRAQEILYGSTLEPFLFGEQIGQTLVARGRQEPLFICIDVAPALALRPLIAPPVVLLCGSAGGDSARTIPQQTIHFEYGGYSLAVLAAAEEDRRKFESEFAEQIEGLDLGEPFQRLEEAIEETQRGANLAAGSKRSEERGNAA